jgi:hypothetical protein
MSRSKPFFRVEEYEEFGRLVAKWILGEKQKPKDYEELAAQLREEEITGIKPDELGDNPVIAWHAYEDGKLNIGLPTRKMLEAAETAIGLQTGKYLFPREYEEAFDGKPLPLDRNQREALQKARLGDYCISICM